MRQPGAKVFMADCEDSLSPGWDNVIGGQVNLRDAVRRTIDFTSPEGSSTAKPVTAVLIVRPRGWHLVEKHIRQGGAAVPGALVDAGLYLFHNARELLARGTGPYFYLPKLESHQEARLWAEVFDFAERELGLSHGTIRCTVLIETILAAFEMDEILHELRDYIVALNCGRWDYIFSFIKKFARRPDFVLPDRQQVAMTTHFLRSYCCCASALSSARCLRDGRMARRSRSRAIRRRTSRRSRKCARTRSEASDGHDGRVAHPALVPVAMEVFDRLMPTPNQLHRLREDVRVGAEDLLRSPRARSRPRGCATTSASRCSTWRPGSRAMAACPSTT